MLSSQLLCGALVLAAVASHHSAQAQDQACYEQALQARRLSQSRIRVSRTAYYLDDCKELCSRELSFRCMGFSYRQPQTQGEVNTCDLTDLDLSSLDRYSTADFVGDNRYDFYQRSGSGYNCAGNGGASSCQSIHKSGHKLYTYRDYKTVTSVAECARACRLTTWCQVVSYRPAASPANQDIGNCLLADIKPDQLRDVGDVAKDSSWNIYSVSFEADCMNGNEPGTTSPVRPSESQQCHRRARTSYRLADLVTADRRTAASLAACAALCANRASCNSLSYRRLGQDPDGHNCYLSAVEAAALTNLDLVFDDDWAVYESYLADLCPAEPGPGPGPPDGICHARERIGYRLPSYSATSATRVATVQDCSDECQRDPACNSFSYRYPGVAATAGDNCVLSGQAVAELVSSSSLLVDDAWDLYQRIESGYNCRGAQTECYGLEHSLYQHYSSFVRASVRAASLAACSARCHEAAYCNTFSYTADTSSSPNCLLSALLRAELSVSGDLVSAPSWAVYSLAPGQGSSCSSVAGPGARPPAQQCHRVERPGAVFYTSVVRDTRTAADLQHCSSLCHQAPYCRSFTYKTNYYLATSNCYLSELAAAAVQQRDLQQDSEWTLYEALDGRDCGHGGGGDRCYTKERAGYKYYSTAVRDVRSVTSLSRCAATCAEQTFCNSFSFRFSSRRDQDNCLLSGLNTSAIYPQTDLVQDRDWDVWQHTCPGPGHQHGDTWLLRTEASKLASAAVAAVSAVSSLRACGRRCEDTAGCEVFSYSSTGYTNCQVARLRYSHLTRADTVKDAKWDIYELRSPGGGNIYFPSNSEGCYSKLRTGYRHYSGYYQSHHHVREVAECEEECARARDCRSFSYRYAAVAGRTNNCLLSGVATPGHNEMVADSNWDVYGSGQCGPGAGASNTINTVDSAFSKDDPVSENANCAEMVRSHYRFSYVASEDRLTAASLKDCSNKCSRETYCNTFSFSVSNGDCHLSSMQYSNLLSQDISYDRDSDLYRPLFGGSCGPGYYPNNNNNNNYNNNINPGSSSGRGCARIWRAQNRLTSLAARESLSARDAAECERMCGTAATYSCRSFSFASGNSWSSGAFSGYSAAAASSCQLSDLGESELRGGDMETDYTSDVFIMGDPASCGSGAPAASSSSFIKCSNFAKPGHRIGYGQTKRSRRALDVADCEEICLRETAFVCRTFAFNSDTYTGNYDNSNNCDLSDRDFRDLAYRDFDEARDWDVIERTRYSGECRDSVGFLDSNDVIIVDRLSCYTKFRSDSTFNARAVVETRRVRDAEECARECDYFRDSGRYQCNGFSISSGSGYGLSYSAQDNCVLTDSYARDFEADLVYSRDYSVYEHSGDSGGRCRSSGAGAGTGVGYPGEYTVGGARCRYGGCKLNPDVHYWYCETDEVGGWDYCCRPGKRCGYSQNYNYPWCYVGEAGFDQWRPCDEDRAALGNRRYNYNSVGGWGRGRGHAYLHEADPPSSPLTLPRDGGDTIVAAGAGAAELPAPNGDTVPFVSLSAVGDKSGGFHPSDGVLSVAARSMDLAQGEQEEGDGEAELETVPPLHAGTGERAEDTLVDVDTFDATVVELDADDYINNTEVFRFLSQNLGSVLEKRNANN